jgi:hypothetical protein
VDEARGLSGFKPTEIRDDSLVKSFGGGVKGGNKGGRE